MRLTDFWMDLLSTTRSGKILGYIDKTIFAIDCTTVAYIVMPLALSAMEATTEMIYVFSVAGEEKRNCLKTRLQRCHAF
jgi:hypothetical protein